MLKQKLRLEKLLTSYVDGTSFDTEEFWRRPRGYWQNEKNVIQEAKRIMKDLKVKNLPSFIELSRLGFRGLANAIQRYYGFTNFRMRLGEKSQRCEWGLWKDENYAVQQALDFMKKNKFNILPSGQVLCRYGRSDLSSVISKYHGGFYKFRAKLGEPKKIREMGVWKSLKYTKDQAREILQKHQLKKLPGGSQLNEMGYSSFVVSVNKYHGGLPRIRRLLGEKPEHSYGIMKNIEYCLKQARRLIQKEGLKRLPSRKGLAKLGYSSLSSAISLYHGGFFNFRKLLGEDPIVEARDSWKSLEFTLEKAKEFLEENLEYETLPGDWTLRSLGYNSLRQSIHKYHGGFNVFRKRFNRYVRLQPLSKKGEHLTSLLEDYVEGENEE
ncbi:MAG: hypothetical protein Q7S27_00240 [Nanoarchaeota archaeon]|nr:hypothetical protein [Nanoarchaeota archaeon]